MMGPAFRMPRLAILAAWLAWISSLPAADAAKSVIAHLKPFVEDHTIAGAVTLVTDKDLPLSFEATGYADIESGRKMDGDTMFWIASMSKPISVACLMMLVDEGKVSMNDPAGKYLPEFKDLMVISKTNEDLMLLKRPAHPVLVRD